MLIVIMKFKWSSLFSFPLVCVWSWVSFQIDWVFMNYLGKVNRESRNRDLRNTYGHLTYFSDELLLGGNGREFHLNLIPRLCYQSLCITNAVAELFSSYLFLSLKQSILAKRYPTF